MHGRKNKQSSFYWGKNLHAFANKQQKSFPLFILAGNIRHNGTLSFRAIFFYTPLKYYSKPLTVESLRFTTTQATVFRSFPFLSKWRAE